MISMNKIYVGIKIKFIKDTIVFEKDTGNTHVYVVNSVATITKKFDKNNFMVDDRYFISKTSIKENTIDIYS